MIGRPLTHLSILVGPTNTNGLVSAVVVTVTLALGLTARTPAAPRHSGTCFPAHSRTLLQTYRARVYTVPDRSSPRPFDTVACAYGLQGVDTLDGGNTNAFQPPAISLAGYLLGYAIDYCDQDTCRTAVVIEDLRAPKRGTLIFRPAGVNSRPVKVGSLRIDGAGHVAWIICPEPVYANGAGGNIYGERKPDCLRPGAKDTVLTSIGGQTVVMNGMPTFVGGHLSVLDRGRRIDPLSLKLRGEALSWISGHRRRHAHL